jgi:beta-lactamase class A
MKFFKNKETTHYKKYFLALIVGVIFGSTVTFFLNNDNLSTVSSKITPIREVDMKTPFIRPLLAYNTPELPPSNPLKEDLMSLVNQKKDGVNSVSVYYRDLNTGKWFGINQDETFIPASLFKVPLMITYLKYAEKHPQILSQEIYNSLDKNENENETIKPLKTVTKGESYTVEQLLNYMIKYSDNNATVLLFKYIDQDTLKEVFSDLDIQLPATGVNSDFMSVTNYSFLFRVLYNATYLNREMSEKGLEILSGVDFKDGLRKPIPSTISVANKFGEYYVLGNNASQERQLHDCGIIYYTKHPYILCVMTKGTSFNALKLILQEISKATYQKVTAAP